MFSWTHAFDAILFDLDGLLIDTEPFHFEAYKIALLKCGHALTWNFSKYQESTCGSSPSLRADVSKLFHIQDWAAFKAKKQEILLNLLQECDISFMPGARELLTYLQSKEKPHAIVTNSRFDEVALISKKLNEIKRVPYLIAREMYKEAKPSGDSYLAAIKKMGLSGKKIIGFEDTLRGITALNKTEAMSVLICSNDHPQLREKCPLSYLHFSDFMNVDIH